jgi:hypothetical protein
VLASAVAAAPDLPEVTLLSPAIPQPSCLDAESFYWMHSRALHSGSCIYSLTAVPWYGGLLTNQTFTRI